MCLLGLSAPAVASYDASAPMSTASNGDVDIAYRVVGDPQAEPILIIMGLSASHRVWNPQLITGLAEGGYRVVLLDNRDVGESSKIEKKGRLWLAWQLLKYRIGLRVKSPYALSDMAVDAVAVLDALGIERAHVIGASMGGMIGQIVAYDFPQRTQSLVSIMSTTWAPHLPQPGRAQQDGISEMNESSEAQAADLQKLGFYPSALPNQVTAILSAGDRTAQVAQISAPTLVLHGADDQLLSVEHGEHTAQTIKDAQFKVYENMGHNLPDPIIPQMVNDMLAHLRANPDLGRSITGRTQGIRLMKFLGYFFAGLLGLAVLGVAILWGGAQMSLDRSYAHTKAAAQLRDFADNDADGVVRIATSRGDFPGPYSRLSRQWGAPFGGVTARFSRDLSHVDRFNRAVVPGGVSGGCL